MCQAVACDENVGRAHHRIAKGQAMEHLARLTQVAAPLLHYGHVGAPARRRNRRLLREMPAAYQPRDCVAAQRGGGQSALPHLLQRSRFPQRAGALKEFVGNVLGLQDDIVHFEYMKKNNRENGPALVGLEIKNPTDLEILKSKLKTSGFQYEYLNKNDNLLQFLT